GAIAHIAVHALGGVRDESHSTAGHTTLAMRCTIKGTASRTAAEIAEDSEMLGGSIGTSIGSEGFGWSMSVPVQHLDSAMALMSDGIHARSIPAETLAATRRLRP